MSEQPSQPVPYGPEPAPQRCIVLLSGGLDSTTTLAMARAQGFDCYTLSLDYGQLHRQELDAAVLISARYSAVEHRVVKVDLAGFGGSSLTGHGQIPKGRSESEMTVIPSTYVPARNTVFLSLALSWAEVVGARSIFIGVNALDYSGYPDCRPEFIEAFEKTANAGTRAGSEGEHYRIVTPLIAMTKAEIVAAGIDLGVNYSETITCYDYIDDGACRECDACQLRAAGFAQAGVPDPTLYR